MRVRWVRRALKSLDEEADYIARDDPQAAAQVVERIASSVDLLASQPALGRPGRVPGTRELVIPRTPYIVPYRMQGESIQILRVYHGARRWPDSF